ncbi:hypothetical protein GGQ74_002203 [Desulfobaculum xiamenense]|uniref:Uncharacterized protein n=1 Tax=Desulfobaculum xiamenense TaxID=995050 RepID=A0A846QND6_9BACT|nr:hypothetical protein [Desulfobaculum xiamenense]NJB68530.1 hypothetical protein [Desulfobaculum xiamenense]
MPARILSAALLELGEDRITSADQDSERARVVSALYEGERDALLEEHPWNFAVARAELARAAGGPCYGYANRFMLPPDCLHVIETDPDARYAVEGQCLLADARGVRVRYVRRVTVVSEMPPTFRSALAARIAARAARKITGSSAEKERMEALYRERLRTAKGRDAQGGGRPESIRPDAFIRARG